MCSAKARTRGLPERSSASRLDWISNASLAEAVRTKVGASSRCCAAAGPATKPARTLIAHAMPVLMIKAVLVFMFARSRERPDGTALPVHRSGDASSSDAHVHGKAPVVHQHM